VPAEGGLVLGLLALGRAISSHTLLDRLIRGRIWIALIAFALIGIVTLQLLVLQLNASIGRTLVREAQLQRENAAYSIENSELASGERVESQAGRLGMSLVPIGALRFLTSDPRADIARAAAALNAPVHGAGEAGTASSTASTAASAGAGTPAMGASAEQAPAGGQSSSVPQAQTAERPPTGETAPAASTQAAVSPTGEAAGAGASSTQASAPVSSAGGTESTGAG
jgi:cell division protein FtsL